MASFLGFVVLGNVDRHPHSAGATSVSQPEAVVAAGGSHSLSGTLLVAQRGEHGEPIVDLEGVGGLVVAQWGGAQVRTRRSRTRYVVEGDGPKEVWAWADSSLVLFDGATRRAGVLFPTDTGAPAEEG